MLDKQRKQDTILRPRERSVTLEERTRFVATTLDKLGIAPAEALSRAEKAVEKFVTGDDDLLTDDNEDDDDVYVFDEN